MEVNLEHPIGNDRLICVTTPKQTRGAAVIALELNYDSQKAKTEGFHRYQGILGYRDPVSNMVERNGMSRIQPHF